MSYNTNAPREWAKDYIDVATRIAEFRAKHPNGSLQPANIDEPIKIISLGDKTYLQYTALAYRNPEDTKPGVGIAWELYPGRTPFTRDSEAMVCETSAWGRAIVAALSADTKKGIATAEEVRAAKSRQENNTENDYVEPKQKLITKEQIVKIQILRKQFDDLQDDNVFYNKIWQSYQVKKLNDLTIIQAADLIKKLDNAISQKEV